MGGRIICLSGDTLSRKEDMMCTLYIYVCVWEGYLFDIDTIRHCLYMIIMYIVV